VTLADTTARSQTESLWFKFDLQLEAQRKLSYTWVVADMDTVVTFTLTATTSGTRLSLVHSGFKPTQKKNFGGARYGWKMMGGKLVDLLDAIP
jgi:uncharacterized protein YndB with AHSA1/START domain